MSKYLVEIIFNQVYTKTDEDDMKSYDTRITTQIYSFEGPNSKHDARNFMDKVIRYGLELKGGSVLKSVIHPSCIMQVGLVDEAKYQEEVAAGLLDTDVELPDSAVSPPVATEATNSIDE